MKTILISAALMFGLAGCVAIDDGYGYYDDYYAPGYSRGYVSSYYTNNNYYRYYDNTPRRWVHRAPAVKPKSQWDRKHDRHDRREVNKRQTNRDWKNVRNADRRDLNRGPNNVKRPVFNNNRPPARTVRAADRHDHRNNAWQRNERRGRD
ncbi:MAG: hypothetical protein GX070_06295 [Alcaligenaceae bacterium]|nr:hypothetical protein [Alcaligenaceae bacterium]